MDNLTDSPLYRPPVVPPELLTPAELRARIAAREARMCVVAEAAAFELTPERDLLP